MDSYDTNGSYLATGLKWLVIGVLAVLGIKLALIAIGVITHMAVVAAFTLGPLLLIGWLALKVLRRFSRDPAVH